MNIFHTIGLHFSYLQVMHALCLILDVGVAIELLVLLLFDCVSTVELPEWDGITRDGEVLGRYQVSCVWQPVLPAAAANRGREVVSVPGCDGHMDQI